MASLDYLRLASYDFNYAKLIAEFMNGWSEQWKRSKWLQYDGWKLGKLFVGVGEQTHRRHMIMSISGSETHKLAEWMHDELSFYATRLDVQRTIEKPLPNQRLMSVERMPAAIEIINGRVLLIVSFMTWQT